MTAALCRRSSATSSAGLPPPLRQSFSTLLYMGNRKMNFLMWKPADCKLPSLLMALLLASVAALGFAACLSKKAANVRNRWWSERSERNLRTGYLHTTTLVPEGGEHEQIVCYCLCSPPSGTSVSVSANPQAPYGRQRLGTFAAFLLGQAAKPSAATFASG